MKKLLFGLLLTLYGSCTLPTPAQAELVRNDCDQIPNTQRVTNGTLCLQRNTASGRTAGSLYVWDGKVWVEKGTSGDLTEVQGTAGEITATGGTGPVPVLSFPATTSLATKILRVGRLEAVAVNSPAQIVGDQNNYAIAATDITLRLSTDVSHTITGMTGGADGRILIVHNVGAQAIVFADESGLSTDLNRFALSGALTLNADQSVIFEYDGTSQRWRAISSAGAGGVVDQTAAYSWTGAHSWKDANFSLLDNVDATKILQFELSGLSAKTTRVWSGPDATTRLLGDSDFSTTGIMSRTAANTYAGRTVVSTNANEFTITNPGGVAGNIGLALGTVPFLNNRSNTITTGDQSFAAAASLTIPSGAGYLPTGAGRIGFNSNNLRFDGGNGTTNRYLAYLDEIQPLNANLTAVAGLTGASAAIPYFTGAGTMGTSQFGLCADSAGQHVNISSLSPLTFTCGSSSTGGLAGGTIGKFLMATGATAFDTSGNLSQTGGVVNASAGLTVGNVATDYLQIDASAVTGAKTWTAINFGGTIRPSTGVLTPGNVVTTNASGQLIDGGAAGTGTTTANNTQTFTEKTLDVEASGNVITTVSYIQLDFASCSGAVAALLWDDDATGAAAPTAACNDTGSFQRPSADFSGSATNSLVRTINLPPDWTGNIDLTLRYATAAVGPSGNTSWQVQTGCRTVGEDWDRAFNAAQTLTADAVGAQNALNDVVQNSLTVTNCTAGGDMQLKITRDGGGGADTNNDLAKAFWVRLKLRRQQ